mgnify:CR=1 FL=1
MLRLLNILLFIFLGLTVFLIVIHIQKIDYYENSSKRITENIYEGQTTISVHLSKYENDDYVLNWSFNHIQSDIIVNDISIQLEKVFEQKSTSLDLIKILPYSGMHPWDIPEYKSFSEIPTSLRKLNTESNPYFAYDLIFGQNANIETNVF